MVAILTWEISGYEGLFRDVANMREERAGGAQTTVTHLLLTPPPTSRGWKRAIQGTPRRFSKTSNQADFSPEFALLY